MQYLTSIYDHTRVVNKTATCPFARRKIFNHPFPGIPGPTESLSTAPTVHPCLKRVVLKEPASKMSRVSPKYAKYAGYSSLITFAVLFLAWVCGFSSRLFAVIRFESIIHEFDPW